MLSMAGITFVLILGTIIGMMIAHFYKPQVLQYVKAPNEIESLKDVVITLGSYVATLDTINPKKVKAIFRYIAKELKKIPIVESRTTKLETEVAEQRMWIGFLINMVVRHDQTISRMKSEITKKDDLIKKLMPEQSITETDQKDSQTIEQENRFDQA